MQVPNLVGSFEASLSQNKMKINNEFAQKENQTKAHESKLNESKIENILVCTTEIRILMIFGHSVGRSFKIPTRAYI